MADIPFRMKGVTFNSQVVSYQEGHDDAVRRKRANSMPSRIIILRHRYYHLKRSMNSALISRNSTPHDAHNSAGYYILWIAM